MYIVCSIFRATVNESQAELYSFPQGSTLGPLLYVTYAAELQTTAERHGVRFHGFADDTQLSISVNPEDAKLAKQTMIDCVASIRQ